MKKKNSFFTFLFALWPGAGQMYLGLPRRGFSIMLVFCGLHQALLHQVLEVIRLAQLPPIPLKAVLTGANREWDSLQLREELLKEREAIAQQQKQQNGEDSQPQEQAQD